jgi:hypothetical protein
MSRRGEVGSGEDRLLERHPPGAGSRCCCLGVCMRTLGRMGAEWGCSVGDVFARVVAVSVAVSVAGRVR